ESRTDTQVGHSARRQVSRSWNAHGHHSLHRAHASHSEPVVRRLRDRPNDVRFRSPTIRSSFSSRLLHTGLARLSNRRPHGSASRLTLDHCGRPGWCEVSLSFSLQMCSYTSVSGRSSSTKLIVKGLVKTFGSVIVTATSRWPKSRRWKRSSTRMASLCPWPRASSQLRSLNPTVSTTRVSPSHLPIE